MPLLCLNHEGAQRHQVQTGHGHDQQQTVDTGSAREFTVLQLKAARLIIPEGLFDGIITNDKFCFTRYGKLRLSWWRRPLRLRERSLLEGRGGAARGEAGLVDPERGGRLDGG